MLAHASHASTPGLHGFGLEGRYRVGERIGKGGSSVVYAATASARAVADHGHLHVALKMLADRRLGDPEAVARFTHEAFLSSRLRHPNLVPAIDFGWAEAGRPYFVMPRCAGAPLDRVLSASGRLPRALVLGLITDTAAALAALHRHGLVHCDVKPSNLFCCVRRGHRARARLLDLGIARVFDPELARKLGAFEVGSRVSYATPAYIAPEQALGLACDARTDVYALACVAYRLLTGVEPFSAATPIAAIRGHLFDDARPAASVNPALPAAVDGVLARAMAKEPSRRTDGSVGFAAELARALQA